MYKLTITTLLTALLITSSVGIVSAQYQSDTSYDLDRRNDFTFGVKLGANLSRMYDAETNDFVADPKVGYAAGVFATIPITTFIGVQPEVLWSQRGFIGRGTFLGNDYRLSRTHNYLDIPILLSIKPSPIVTILVGPQYSYLLSTNDEYTSGNTTFEDQNDFDNDNVLKNTLALTGGLDLSLDPLVVGLRAGWDIRKNDGDGTTTSIRYKNMWYQLSIGFQF
jgi:hypothetical protein